MENYNWETIEYTKENGETPVDEFMDELNTKEEAKVLRSIALLEEFGLIIGMPHVRHLDDGIYELRTKFSSNIFRVTIFHWYKDKIVLLHGFKKKTQKTPPREIKRAKEYREDFLKQKGE